MKHLLAAVLAVSLVACAAEGPRVGTLTRSDKLATDTYACNAGGSPHDSSCKNIPIVVLVRADQTCLVVIPYGTLSILAGNGAGIVQWNLQAPDRYTFDDQSVKIIASADPADPKPVDVYEDGKAVGNGKAYQWKLKLHRRSAKFQHDILIKNPSGGGYCDYVDPIIHNDAN